jgi:hypothetical protein
MVGATYQTRLSAIILGIRPSASHVYGSVARTPADNLTMVGIDAWQIGLRQLQRDLRAAGELSGGELWIREWIDQEIGREAERWTDASSMLELLALALGPASADASAGPRGRLFWTQWQQNVAHYRQQVEVGAAAASADSEELLEHCITLVESHGGPLSVTDDLAMAQVALGAASQPAAVFRPLTSAVERLQLSAILGSAYDDAPVCTAAMARLLEQRPPTLPCHTEATLRRRSQSWRHGAATTGY